MVNPGLKGDHASIVYYDGDYPSPDGTFPENFDEAAEHTGVAYDVRRYVEIALSVGGPILEPFCGSGRVSIPLAREGFSVTGVDLSDRLLDMARGKLLHEKSDVQERVQLIESDVRHMNLSNKYKLAIAAFNSLNCLPDFRGQIAALESIFQNLQDNGILVLDVANPLTLSLNGNPIPKPIFTRRNPNSGNTYTRFAAFGPLDETQCQKFFGWYDEILPDGIVSRRNYSFDFRPIFQYELQLMLERVGFDIVSVEGGHRKEKFTASSPHLFVVAQKVLRE